MNNRADGINATIINIFKLEDCDSHQRDDLQSNSDNYYMISLLRNCDFICQYNKDIGVSDTALLFLNPKTSYKINLFRSNQTGFLCLFSKSFFTESVNTKLNALPMCARINEQQDLQISGIFTRMLCEMDSDYTFKYDLLRNYISELTHFALKFLSDKIV